MIVEDLSLETRFSGPQLLVDHGVTSGMSVIIGPLKDPYGVMGVHTVEHRIFSPFDVEFVQVVANVLANIINQNRISHELEESETRYRLLVENASDMISTHKTSGNYSYASPYSLELIGYLPEELKGESAFIFIHQDDIELVKENQANQKLLKEFNKNKIQIIPLINSHGPDILPLFRGDWYFHSCCSVAGFGVR